MAKSFIFRKDVGGSRFFRSTALMLRLATSLLTNGKARSTGAVWDHEPKWVTYGSTRRTGNDVDLWAVVRRSKSDHMVAKNQGGSWEALVGRVTASFWRSRGIGQRKLSVAGRRCHRREEGNHSP
jgi:hypothetical protein